MPAKLLSFSVGDRLSLCILGLPEIHSVAQVDLESTEICLPVSPQCWDKGCVPPYLASYSVVLEQDLPLWPSRHQTHSSSVSSPQVLVLEAWAITTGSPFHTSNSLYQYFVLWILYFIRISFYFIQFQFCLKLLGKLHSLWAAWDTCAHGSWRRRLNTSCLYPSIAVPGRGAVPVTSPQVTPLQHTVPPHTTEYFLSFLLPRLCNIQTRPHVTDGAWRKASHAGARGLWGGWDTHRPQCWWVANGCPRALHPGSFSSSSLECHSQDRTWASCIRRRRPAGRCSLGIPVAQVADK